MHELSSLSQALSHLVNSGSNFFIYLAISEKFRLRLLELWQDITAMGQRGLGEKATTARPFKALGHSGVTSSTPDNPNLSDGQDSCTQI